jgi:hypothetical protein
VTRLPDLKQAPGPLNSEAARPSTAQTSPARAISECSTKVSDGDVQVKKEAAVVAQLIESQSEIMAASTLPPSPEPQIKMEGSLPSLNDISGSDQVMFIDLTLDGDEPDLPSDLNLTVEGISGKFASFMADSSLSDDHSSASPDFASELLCEAPRPSESISREKRGPSPEIENEDFRKRARTMKEQSSSDLTPPFPVNEAGVVATSHENVVQRATSSDDVPQEQADDPTYSSVDSPSHVAQHATTDEVVEDIAERLDKLHLQVMYGTDKSGAFRCRLCLWVILIVVFDAPISTNSTILAQNPSLPMLKRALRDHLRRTTTKLPFSHKVLPVKSWLNM